MGEDKVCDTCGDIGYETALVICKKCKVGCEHLYCMRKFYMAAPADWCCEMCKSISMDSSDCGLKKESFKAVTCDLSTKLHHGPKDFTDRKSFCKGARGNWHEKAVGTGKTKYLWTSEVKNMPSGEKKGESTCVGPVSRKPSKSIASEHNIASMKPKSIIYADSSFMVKSNPKFGPSRNSSVRSGNIQNNTSVKKVKELKSIISPVKEDRQMRQTSCVKDTETSHAKKQKKMKETASTSHMSRHNQTCDIPQTNASLSPAIPLVSTEVIKRTDGHWQKKISKESCADCQSPMSGVELTEDAKPKNSDADNVVFSVKEFYIKAAAEEPLPTDPATIASWTGSFILKDEKTSISFQAHPRSQGLSKVKEFCRKMPEVLEFELCLYEDFLRTVFKGCDPDDQDIGLYFFPDDRIRPNAYISHLEQLSGNFFLRSCIDGVELLVFTSKVLHKDYRSVELTEDAKPKNSDADNVVFSVKEFYIKAAAEEPLPTDPATIASWTGSFILKDEKTSISFQAHPRSQGLSKVKEFCRKMPEVLEFELCLYEDFLRTVFKGCDPDDQDIGLYFFPDDRIRPNAYISHLEQLSGNFFLRSCIDGVELLVFTSKVLHKDYRKRNKCDFLWGIYRHRHRKLKVAVEETMVVDMDIDSEEVDMEVDMIGGETVGTVDVVVPKQLTESDIDIPPGFSPSMRGQWKTKIKQEVWKF
ncbi:hypothetical protein ACET3Z_010314 [Daucus carota]